MDPVQHSSVNLISASPLVADPHEAAHVTVGLSSIPEAGQGQSQKKDGIHIKYFWRLTQH